MRHVFRSFQIPLMRARQVRDGTSYLPLEPRARSRRARGLTEYTKAVGVIYTHSFDTHQLSICVNLNGGDGCKDIPKLHNSTFKSINSAFRPYV